MEKETVESFLTASTWSPYLVGMGIGVLSWLAFLLSNHPLGVSTALAKTAGMIERLVRGDKVLNKQYYRKNIPGIDWEWISVAGLFLGALSAAWLSGDLQSQWVPEMWRARFGENVPLRLGTAVIGGVLVGFGARWGRGCTSGHGISGTLQLVLSSWIAAICFFTGSVVVAMMMY